MTDISTLNAIKFGTGYDFLCHTKTHFPLSFFVNYLIKFSTMGLHVTAVVGVIVVVAAIRIVVVVIVVIFVDYNPKHKYLL